MGFKSSEPFLFAEAVEAGAEEVGEALAGLVGPDEVDGPVDGGCLAVPVKVVYGGVGGGCLVGPDEVDGPVDGGCLAFPGEVVYGGGHLVGPDAVDGPVDRCRLAGPELVEDGSAEEALAGLFVFLAWLTSQFATAVERILMASPILFFFSACSLAFFFCRWN